MNDNKNTLQSSKSECTGAVCYYPHAITCYGCKAAPQSITIAKARIKPLRNRSTEKDDHSSGRPHW